MSTKEIGAPVNLSYVREIAEGDDELEQEMVSAFVTQSDESVETLRESCVSGNVEAWRDAAHALKGGAKILGAITLSDLSEQGQHFKGDGDERAILLQRIQAEYGRVKSYLQMSHVT